MKKLNINKLLPLLVAVLPLAILASAAHAQINPLTVVLTPEGGASVLPGGTLVYDAVFTNTTGADYLIDDATLNVQDPQTQGLLTPLFTGPYTAAQGTTSLTDAFEIAADPSLTPQTNVLGDVSFSGSPLGGQDVEAANAPVKFQIASVPEASTTSSMGLGLLSLASLAVLARRRRAVLSDNGSD